MSTAVVGDQSLALSIYTYMYTCIYIYIDIHAKRCFIQVAVVKKEKKVPGRQMSVGAFEFSPL